MGNFDLFMCKEKKKYMHLRAYVHLHAWMSHSVIEKSLENVCAEKKTKPLITLRNGIDAPVTSSTSNCQSGKPSTLLSGVQVTFKRFGASTD